MALLPPLHEPMPAAPALAEKGWELLDGDVSMVPV
jgi:hypothetical protein